MTKLIPVESSMIQAVGYNRKERLLEVVFDSGRTYSYEDVPPATYKALMAADSKGRYMLYAFGDYRRLSMLSSLWTFQEHSSQIV